MSDAFSSIKIIDLEIFLEVSSAKSIREVSRRLSLSPAKVSKTIRALESKLGTKVYKRSVMGVLPTAEGADLLEVASNMVQGCDRIKELLSGQGKQKMRRALAIASTSFLNTHFTTPVTCAFANHFSEKISFKFLDLPPDQLVPVALRGGFEIAVHYGAIPWPSTWTTKKLGTSKWVLICKQAHPISKRPSLKQILQYPFVYPAYWSQEGISRGNDEFPVPISKRKLGFETATADAAVPIVLQSDQLAFLPEILVRSQVKRKKLRVIESADLKDINKELHISVRSDIVPVSLFNGLAEKMSAEILR